MDKCCGKRAFELLEKLAYVRVSGTAEELEAAKTLQEVARSVGVECEIEPFEVEDGEVISASLEVLEPYQKAYQVTGFIRSDSTPEEGLELEFKYVENAEEANLVDVAGKAVMVNGMVRKAMYERLKKAGVAAVISFSGTTIDKEDETDLGVCKLRPMLTEAHGFTVAVNLRVKDAVDMVRKHASKVRINVQSKRFNKTSHNVCAVIPGTRFPEQVVSFGAHYDSVHFSTGVYDNMSGSVIVMEMLRYFAANPPARTVKFNWYGSEEQGLLGSKAYVAAHKDELDKHVLMINVDVAGPVLGCEVAHVTGTKEFTNYVDAMMKEAGLAVGVGMDIYSSDSIPFADNGVPGINFCRNGAGGASYIHDRRDHLDNDFMSAEGLQSTCDVVQTFSTRVINAPVFPIEKKLDDEIRDKVDKYLFKKK